MEHVRLTELDDIEQLAELERWDDSDRTTWRRIAALYADWMLTLDEDPRRVTAESGSTTITEEVRPKGRRAVLDALVRLSERLDPPD
jgi:hypothetical protein